MNRKRIEEFEDCPVIAAIKDEEGLKKCLHSDIQIVFVLYGDICNIGKIVGKLKAAGKTVIIHIDLIAGLSSKEIAVTYIKSVTHADGIISTKPGVIREAKEEGLFAIMRFFVIDSIAFDSIQKQTESVRPDMIEVLPGVMPKIIRRICRESRVPVIAGGLIADKEDAAPDNTNKAGKPEYLDCEWGLRRRIPRTLLLIFNKIYLSQND